MAADSQVLLKKGARRHHSTAGIAGATNENEVYGWKAEEVFMIAAPKDDMERCFGSVLSYCWCYS
jgi:hypothetical protein